MAAGGKRNSRLNDKCQGKTKPADKIPPVIGCQTPLRFPPSFCAERSVVAESSVNSRSYWSRARRIYFADLQVVVSAWDYFFFASRQGLAGSGMGWAGVVAVLLRRVFEADAAAITCVK